MPTYNHAYCICFEVPGSTDEDAEDVTAERLRECLMQRIETLDSESSDAWMEAAADPYDTYEEETEKSGTKPCLKLLD